MRLILAALVVGLGVVVTVAGAAALYNFGVIADETRISGWNPALWILLLSGVATVLVGTAQVAIATADRPARRESPASPR